ncbi:hypothetical protein [Parasutterella excrementihominis]|uniref:hypothetical protein n=1 Tax=Parasutterella excrementihominis TaxID=487175 RepID=UPI003FEE68AD
MREEARQLFCTEPESEKRTGLVSAFGKKKNQLKRLQIIEIGAWVCLSPQLALSLGLLKPRRTTAIRTIAAPASMKPFIFCEKKKYESTMAVNGSTV